MPRGRFGLLGDALADAVKDEELSDVYKPSTFANIDERVKLFEQEQAAIKDDGPLDPNDPIDRAIMDRLKKVKGVETQGTESVEQSQPAANPGFGRRTAGFGKRT